MLLNALVTALDLPLYLDTVGTVTAAVIGGYLPGVLVGFVTNLIKSLTDSSSLYYGFLNVLIAFFAAMIARKGWFQKVIGVIGAIILFALIGGGIGAMIPWYIEGLSFDSEALSGVLYETGFFSPALSHILSSILIEIGRAHV